MCSDRQPNQKSFLCPYRLSLRSPGTPPSSSRHVRLIRFSILALVSYLHPAVRRSLKSAFCSSPATRSTASFTARDRHSPRWLADRRLLVIASPSPIARKPRVECQSSIISFCRSSVVARRRSSQRRWPRSQHGRPKTRVNVYLHYDQQAKLEPKCVGCDEGRWRRQWWWRKPESPRKSYCHHAFSRTGSRDCVSLSCCPKSLAPYRDI